MRRTATAFLTAALLAIGASQIASAADLPRKQPAYIPPPLPVYNWTGCYVGVNIGGAWGNVDVTDVNTGAGVSPNNSGFAGGGQIGCDYQMNQWVIGIRNVFDGTSISNGATISDPLFAGTINSHVHWFDALTARGGYLVQPNILLYAQGGAAWTSWDVTAFNTAGVQVGQISGGNRTGWTAGAGVECHCRRPVANAAPLVAAGAPIHRIGFVGNVVGALKVEIVGHRHPIEKSDLIRSIIGLLK